ncbi:MAG: glycosyltransferase family 2 protein [Euryarchaeota archaeon]|nr:glycosyltransferase family 2 protein [Euryarchaeota archaeon]
MVDAVLLLFEALAAVSFAVGVGSVLGGIRFRIRAWRIRRKPWPPYSPPAAVIVACKGVDPGLDRNLALLLDQDYSEYRVIFALDSLEDPAHAVIREAAAKSKVPVTFAVAEPRPNCTGKAAALIRAGKELSTEDQVVAFMDSDARPPRHWLRSLVAPLQDSSIGATTAYRWYTHEASLASAIRSAWNAAGTNIMFEPRWNFAWGGSSALRRETFDRTYIAAKWGSALSDDMIVTQAVKGVGLRVEYVPHATVLTEEPSDWPSVLEWTTRQTVMMRAYDRRVTRYAALAYATVAGSVDLGIALAVVAAIADSAYWIPALLFLSHVPSIAAKAAIRLQTFRTLLGQTLGPLGWFVLGSLIVPWVALFNLSVARKLRVISWRGTLYELRGPPPIRVVRR